MIEQELLTAMLDKGFNPGQVVADGKYHRFDIRKGDKAGYYNLDANGHGVYGNWKTAEQFIFRSGKSQEMSSQERMDALAKYRAEARQRREDQQNAESKAAVESNNIWNNGKPVPRDHPYLQKKGIQPHDFRIDHNGVLILPIYDGKKIVNLQRIFEDGKKFIYQAKKKGCYGKISGLQDIIFITEGYATAASINEATGRLCVVGLDATNLIQVAKMVRSKFGVSQKIIIAGDNDQWTEIRGEPHNTGRIEAEKCGKEIYADVKIPDFPADDPEKNSDWNDYARLHGLRALSDKLMPPAVKQALAEQPTQPLEPVNDQLDLNSEGKPKPTIENLGRVCRNRGVILRYNVIKKQEEILIPKEGFSVDNAMNAAYARIMSFCKEDDMPTAALKEYLTYLTDKCPFNPVQSWITSKEWDGKSRLEEFFATVRTQNTTLRDTILLRWLLSAVAAVFEPNGVSAHGVLVFRGEQYIGKTSWFKKLAPPHLDVIKDGYILRLDNKDSVFQCLSHWIVELGELEATFRKSDIAQLKAFITSDRDILRRPYAIKESFYARRTVFFASVNQKEFLFDETGNRRFWTIETDSIDYAHTIDMQQLWAEVYGLYLDREPWIMQSDEITKINSNNEEFMGPDYHEELVSRRFDWKELEFSDGVWKTATEIARILTIQNPKQLDLNRISKAVKKYNGNKTKRGHGGIKLLCVPREKMMVDEDLDDTDFQTLL